MCGVAGFWHLDKRPMDVAALRRMTLLALGVLLLVACGACGTTLSGAERIALGETDLKPIQDKSRPTFYMYVTATVPTTSDKVRAYRARLAAITVEVAP